MDELYEVRGEQKRVKTKSRHNARLIAVTSSDRDDELTFMDKRQDTITLCPPLLGSHLDIAGNTCRGRRYGRRRSMEDKQKGLCNS